MATSSFTPRRPHACPSHPARHTHATAPHPHPSPRRPLPAQLDDMLTGTAFPVVCVPGDAAVLQDSGAEPLLFYTQARRARSRGAGARGARPAGGAARGRWGRGG
jgi:hypothetical protein